MKRFLLLLGATLLCQTFHFFHLADAAMADAAAPDNAVRYPAVQRLADEPGIFAQCLDPRASLFAELTGFLLTVFIMVWLVRRKRARAAEHSETNLKRVDA